MTTTTKDDYGDRKSPLKISKLTGIVYHEDMVQHYCLWDDNYPECPERFTEILKRCEALNLLDRCARIPTRLADLTEIRWKHSSELITLLDDCRTKNEEELEKFCSRYDAIFVCRDTYRLALLAAGSAINLVDAICTNEIRNGMAIIRPPGHHAMESAYCGYCFFNNIALAAEHALKKFNLKKILIVDWDVHHGQATQQMFYNDPRVLYFSIHRFEHGEFWPNLRESNADYIGEGVGEGFNFNVPLNKTGLGNADYLTIFHQLLLPVAVEYQPELILVSAGYDAAIGCLEFAPELILVSCGFDAALGDEKGKMEVTPACYAHLVNSLSHLANGKIAVILEGGYFLKSLAEGAALSLRSLLGDACPDIGAVGEIDKSVWETILNVIYTHKNHWNCLQIHDQSDEMEPHSTLPCYSPRIEFNYIEEVIHEFPTRDCYPLHTEPETACLNARIDELIRNTELTSANFRCLVYSSRVSKNYQSIRSIIPEDFVVDVNQNDDYKSTIPFMLEKIVKNISRSVVIDQSSYEIEEKDVILECTINHLIEKMGLNRVLLVQNNSFRVVRLNDDRLLNVDLSDYRDAAKNTDRDFHVQYPFGHPTNDLEFFLFLTKILLPIAYQYNPEIIIVSLSFHEGDHLLPITYSHLVHWLTSLARGKLIFVANYDSANERENLSFSYCCKILLGDRVPACTSDDIFKTKLSTASNTSLRALVQHLKTKWLNLDFMVKFAENANDIR